MSQYQVLDAALLANLQDGKPKTLIKVSGGAAHEEATRIAEATGREAFRVVDGRLQALRKAGKIRFDSKSGWTRIQDARS